jgi:hypothetical protein
MHEDTYSVGLSVFDLALIPAIPIIDSGEHHDYFIMGKTMR